MNTTSFEITDKEYLIKLDRSKFNLNVIRTILKMIERNSPSDDAFSIPDRNFSSRQTNFSNEPDYYSSLEEK